MRHEPAPSVPASTQHPQPHIHTSLAFTQPQHTRHASHTPRMDLPSLSLIANATLKKRDGEGWQDVAAKSLWEKQPVFIYCIRRPGCILCRDQAQAIWARKAELEAAGVRVVSVVQEYIDREVEAFVPEFWGGELLWDAEKQLYRAFGEGGQLRPGSALSLLNPFSPIWGRVFAARSRVRTSNLSGDSSIMGGLLLVKAGEGGIGYVHAEVTFGEFPPIDEVIAAVKRALAAGGGAQ